MNTTPSLKPLEKLQMERQKLLSSTQKYKQALESQVSEMKEGAVRVAIQGLVFGGIALGTYLLVRAFSGGKKEKVAAPSSEVPATTSITSALFASIQSYIASFLLSLAREKITQYLESYLLKQNEAASENKG